jgi:hypothetical protein
MVAELVSLISILIAVGALVLTLWQNILTRKAHQATALMSLEQLGIDRNYNQGIELIYGLMNYEDFTSFKQTESEATQSHIFNMVDFLNFAAHLVESGFLPRQSLWNLYFWTYRNCSQKLLPWWLEGQRQNNPQRFAAFERMCWEVGNVSEEAIRNFDARRARRTKGLGKNS